MIVTDWIAFNALRNPDNIATLERPSGRQRTYAEFHERIGRTAAWLKSLGIQKGDRVGVLALNSTDTLDLIFATWRIGAIHLALNFRLTPSELDYIIGNADPKMLIHDTMMRDTVSALTVKIDKIVETEGQGGDSEFEQALAKVSEPIMEMVDMEPDDICMLMYSSGTTGLPKGVIMTHGMLIWAQYNFIGEFEVGGEMVSYAVMPLFHIGGLQVFTFPALCFGGLAIVERAFDPAAALAAIGDKDLRISHFIGVPAIFNAMRDHPANKDTDFSRLKHALCGAEAVPEALVKWWHERGLTILEGYGMTENMASCCVQSFSTAISKVGSCGKRLKHTDIRVIRDDGSDCEPHESGEIVCRGPIVTPGYWSRLDENDKFFIDGWFRTGDIGYFDEGEFLYIEDRLKDMYISGGENVYPAEVENILYQLKEIREVAVIGVPDEKWGETGCVVVAFHEGQSLTTKEVIQHCEPQLARFKLPNHVVVVDALPRNATGKVLKFKLRETVQV